MKALSAVDAFSPALQHARAQLFPFRFGQWARLALLGLLTGEMGSHGGCNFRLPYNFPPPSSGSSRHLLGSAAWDPHALAAIAFWVALLVVGAVALALLMIYISSVCRFMLFESVLDRHCALRRGWARWQQPGWRYFGFQLLLAFLLLAGLGVIVGVPVVWAITRGLFHHPGEHLAFLIASGVVVVLLTIMPVFAGALVSIFTKDFVIPQMALEGVGVMEGWRRLLRMLRVEKVPYAGYVGMKIIMALAAAIIFGIASLFVFLLALIPVGLLAFIAVMIGKSMGLGWNAVTISLAVAVAVVLVLALVYVAAFVATPVTVFFPAYSMYFFAGRYPPLGARLAPAPPPAAPAPLPAV